MSVYFSFTYGYLYSTIGSRLGRWGKIYKHVNAFFIALLVFGSVTMC